MNDEREQVTGLVTRGADVAAAAAAPERAGRRGFLGAMLLLLAGVVLLTALTAATYRGILHSRDASDTLRGTLSYLKAQVKNHDAVGGVTLRAGTLVLTESAGGDVYELRIYESGGTLWEEYCAAGAAGDPARAAAIAATDVFDAVLVQPDLLRLTTDAGTAYVALRAAVQKGGAA